MMITANLKKMLATTLKTLLYSSLLLFIIEARKGQTPTLLKRNNGTELEQRTSQTSRKENLSHPSRRDETEH
jgi:hypothetical protein